MDRPSVETSRCDLGAKNSQKQYLRQAQRERQQGAMRRVLREEETKFSQTWVLYLPALFTKRSSFGSPRTFAPNGSEQVVFGMHRAVRRSDDGLSKTDDGPQ
jgi:hypothetical protein